MAVTRRLHRQIARSLCSRVAYTCVLENNATVVKQVKQNAFKHTQSLNQPVGCSLTEGGFDIGGSVLGRVMSYGTKERGVMT